MRDQLAPNFYRDEFVCKCGCGFDDVDPRLVEALQALREAVGVPVMINSACRCPAHNAAVGGSTKSQHLLGKAADIRTAEYTPGALRENVLEIPAFRDGGVGLYATFVHADVRGYAARW